MMSGLNGWSWFHDYSDPPKPPPCVTHALLCPPPCAGVTRARTCGALPCRYVPSKRDLAYGAEMRRVWLEFAREGTLEPLGWEPVTSATGFPQHYTTAILNVTVASVVDLRADLCSWWASRGIGQGYWWTN